jgi:hypothetical protein
MPNKGFKDFNYFYRSNLTHFSIAIAKNVKLKIITLKKSMTLTLNLPSEVEQYLLQEAHQKGLSIESVTLQLLTSFIVLRQKQTKAVNLLQSWIDDEDIEEQKETGQYLISSLDEDRLSERKLFPLEMKGVSW